MIAIERTGGTPDVQRGPQQGERAQHIGPHEDLRIGDRAVDMRLRGQMHDPGDAMFFK